MLEKWEDNSQENPTRTEYLARYCLFWIDPFFNGWGPYKAEPAPTHRSGLTRKMELGHCYPSHGSSHAERMSTMCRHCLKTESYIHIDVKPGRRTGGSSDLVSASHSLTDWAVRAKQNTQDSLFWTSRTYRQVERCSGKTNGTNIQRCRIYSCGAITVGFAGSLCYWVDQNQQRRKEIDCFTV